MKRFVVLVGITCLVLVWSSSFLIAGSPNPPSDHPSIVAPRSGDPNGDDFPWRSGGASGDEGKGDADDLAGAKGGMLLKGTNGLDGSFGEKARMMWRIWLVYFFVHRI